MRALPPHPPALDGEILKGSIGAEKGVILEPFSASQRLSPPELLRKAPGEDAARGMACTPAGGGKGDATVKSWSALFISSPGGPSARGSLPSAVNVLTALLEHAAAGTADHIATAAHDQVLPQWAPPPPNKSGPLPGER